MRWTFCVLGLVFAGCQCVRLDDYSVCDLTVSCDEGGLLPDGGADDAGGRDGGADDAGGRDGGTDDAGGRDGGADDAGGRDGGADDAGGRDGGADDAGARSWTQITTTGAIAARTGTAMAYDSSRQRVVLFGGQDLAGTLFSDTWEYNPATSTWTERVVTGGPSGRTFAGMAFDSVRNVTVLFAGSGSSTSLSDTWEWNGTAWTRPPATMVTPMARGFFGCWWDPNRQRVGIYGGFDTGGSILSDTFEWDGANWTPRSLTGLARAVHSVAYDLSRQRMVFFGGQSTGGSLNGGTWELDTTWTQTTPTNPPPSTYGGAMAYDGRSGTVVLVGGSDTEARAGAWSYDGTTWTMMPTNLGVRSHGAMVFDSTRQRLIHFGGYSSATSVVAETWEY